MHITVRSRTPPSSCRWVRIKMSQAGISTGSSEACFPCVRGLRVSSLGYRNGPRPWFLHTGVLSSRGKGLQSHRLTLLVTTALQARIAPITEKSDFTRIQGETISLISYGLVDSDTGVLRNPMHAFFSGSSQFKGWKMGKCPVPARPGLDFAVVRLVQKAFPTTQHSWTVATRWRMRTICVRRSCKWSGLFTESENNSSQTTFLIGYYQHPSVYTKPKWSWFAYWL